MSLQSSSPSCSLALPIRLWKDTWCRDVELARRFPQLFNVAAQKSATVGELWDQNAGQGGWNLRFFRSFNDWELALVDELLQILRSQRITLEEDLALWKGGKNGKFDVKDAYGLLTSHSTSLFPKKGIWVENVASKLAFFAWEATWGRGVTIRKNSGSKCRGRLYDVDTFLTHRFLSSGELEVRVRFVGFGAEEDEWVNVKKAVRERSLPLEHSECHKVKVGDVVLCFQTTFCIDRLDLRG
uniref:SAWADEE domain-containing protein n=1 Tax=Vitis vinifera TaxID=29760 RepID=A5BT31_VITVI|nr:hypothetical protein VITISV_008770 [Vitis vinifera]